MFHQQSVPYHKWFLSIENERSIGIDYPFKKLICFHMFYMVSNFTPCQSFDREKNNIE